MVIPSIPQLQFTEHQLENGLKVILQENRRTPLVHLSLHYMIGSSYESKGRSGFAHLFEHMMFQGSRNLAKNEHGKLIDSAGGQWNASTNKDRTNYYETVPSHYLDLVLWLEADRMEALEVTPENFENQRQTVIEEKKQSYDNRPYGKAFLRFDELAYENWAYAHPVIGSVEDLQQATLEQAVEFHRRFYGPGNATLVVTGDIVQPETLEKIQKYFEDIPNKTNAVRPELSEPQQLEEKLESTNDPLAVLPAVIIGYHIPPLGSTDDYALAMAALVLADGDSSRFYRKFVYENNWIAGLVAGSNHYRGPQLFRVWFQIQQNVPISTILEAMESELDRLRDSGITDAELEKAQNQVAHRLVAQMERVSNVGELLAQYSSFFDDPNLANRQLERFLSVSKEQIQLAVQRYLSRENRTVIIVEPGASE